MPNQSKMKVPWDAARRLRRGIMGLEAAPLPGRDALGRREVQVRQKRTALSEVPGAEHISGLTSTEVERRRARGEINRAVSPTSRPVSTILRSNIFTLFNAILAGAVLLLLLVGQVRDAILTSGLVVFSVGVSIFQEVRAKHRLDEIALLVRSSVQVIRDGRVSSIDQSEIVLGDYLLLARGDQVVADGIVMVANLLEVDESLLTGESEPVIKDQGDRVLSGSFCVAGSGVYRAEGIGGSAYAQQLAVAARMYRNPRTPTQRLVDQVLKALLVVVGGLSVLQAVVFISSGVSVVDAVRATAVIATLVPQGLLFMSTVAYSLGAVRLAQMGALVQRLNAVESLSQINVLCLDKTGTLTANRLRLRQVIALGRCRARAEKVLAAFAASFPEPNPTLRAIASALPESPHPVAVVVPFSSERRWSGITFAPPSDFGTVILGAPEVLAPRVRNAADLAQKSAELAGAGLRVLMLAQADRPISANRRSQNQDEASVLPRKLEALALVVLEEELRPQASATLAAFADAGVDIKIISGDNPQTALAVGRWVGLPSSARAVSWGDIASQPPAEVAKALEEASVFGRVSPRDKQEIVQALEAGGHYVAMIGDGVNDVLAMKQANVSVAMRSGSSATRAIADVVLLKDSFDVLPKALTEGRRIVNSMLLLVKLFLIRDVATIELILASNLLGAPFPLFPPHAAVVGFLAVGVPAVLVVAWASADVPRRQSLREIAVGVLQLGTANGLAVVSVYLLTLLGFEAGVAQARTVVVTASLLSGVLVLLLFSHPLDAPLDLVLTDRRVVALGAMIMAVYVVGLYSPTVQRLLELTPLSLPDWAVILSVVLAWFGVLRLAVRYQATGRPAL